MIISYKEAQHIAERIWNKHSDARINGVTDFEKLSMLIKQETGRNIRSQHSLGKVEAALCSM